VVRARVERELPFMATESILMAATVRGGDRQELHERLRVHARASADARAASGAAADLLDRLAGDAAFGLSRADLDAIAAPEKLVGRSSEQVEIFVREELDPALAGAEAAASAPVRV
jgi:adenylosuccinate lyase